VRWVIVFEGVNDLGGLTRDGEVSPADHALRVSSVLAAYAQIVARATRTASRVWGHHHAL